MKQEPKPNTGALFKNDRKTKETHPQATGNATVVCPHCNWASDYFMDGYTNDGPNGKWQRLKFKAKDKQGAQGAAAQAQHVGKPEDDDIPF
jgi:hypothetical protein